MKTYIKLTALLLSAVLVLGGCSISQLEDEQSEPEVIKIGVLEPLSGAAEDGGDPGCVQLSNFRPERR